MPITRREVLKTLGASMAAAVVDTMPAQAEDPKDKNLQRLLASLERNFVLDAPEMKPEEVPFVPAFGERGEDIIKVANRILAQAGPKFAVYPRIVWGGTYTPEAEIDEVEKAWLTAFNTNDRWSVLSFPGNGEENGAWFYPLTETTNYPGKIAEGSITEVVHFPDTGRQEVKMPVQKLDAMMAVNLARLENVAVRALPKVAGQLSFVLADDHTRGAVIIGFAMNPNFTENMTNGDPDSVPAVIVHGMPGAEVNVQYFSADGSNISSVSARIESTNGTLSVEVPADGGFVTVGVPVRGDHKNANTELLMRMGTQPKADIPGKNYVSYTE